MKSHRVVTQCRIPDDAFRGRGLDNPKGGKPLAPVGAELDSKKLPDGLLDRLMQTGAIEEIGGKP